MVFKIKFTVFDNTPWYCGQIIWSYHSIVFMFLGSQKIQVVHSEISYKLHVLTL